MVCLVVYLCVLIFGVALPFAAWMNQEPDQSFFRAYLKISIFMLAMACFMGVVVGAVVLGGYVYTHCFFGV